MRILQCIESMNPFNGGTVESVKQMSRALRDLDAVVDIATIDPPLAPWADAALEMQVLCFGPGRTLYNYSAALLSWLRTGLANYDVAIINGIWRHHSVAVGSIARAQGLPYYVIPHSMLNPWLRNITAWKRIKKDFFWRLFERKTFCHARAVLFTSEEERSLARSTFGLHQCRDCVIPLGTADPRGRMTKGVPLLTKFPELVGKRLVVFLGRLHPVKGCDLLLHAFHHVASRDPRLHLVIAGPDTERWRPELERIAASRGLRGRVLWTGPVSGDDRWSLLEAAELFALPSHCEAFPYALIEALGCGVPVLTTNKVNIYREIEGDGCALICSDDEMGVSEALVKWFAMPQEAVDKLRAGARHCFESRFSSKVAARRMLDLFERDAEELSRPCQKD
jgi:glycosyltransferase involved in cell wall biosynthesis